jgi:ProP effector
MSTTPAAPADSAATEAQASDTPVVDATEASAAPAAKTEISPAATGARLAELFPALFTGPAKPFKLRIQVDIQERAPGEFSKQALSAFFRRHTGTTPYLIAVSQGTQRFDLDGQPVGELTEEHRQVATDELARRRAITKARREEAIQAQREAQREVQREARKQDRAAQQQDQQAQQERRNRAQLLRDFDTTRLTAANFCALKGIAPDALEAILAQAREEAKQDALRPRPEGRRDHRDAPRGEHRGGPREGQGRAPRAPGAEGALREGRGPRREGGREGGGREGGRPDNRPPRKTS